MVGAVTVAGIVSVTGTITSAGAEVEAIHGRQQLHSGRRHNCTNESRFSQDYMDQIEKRAADRLSGRIRDLSARTLERDYLTHTEFLTSAEQAFCRSLLVGGAAGPVPWTMYGGWEEAERQTVCFLPSYMSADDFVLSDAASGEVISCVRISPLNARFSDHPGHRDYLGALMNIRIERDRVGDILIDSSTDTAYVFCLSSVSGLIINELSSVRHTSVECCKVPASECSVRPEFKEVTGSVASLRLDAVLSLVYHISRTRAKELIDADQVSIGGTPAKGPGQELKENDRISVRGHGKFVFDQVLKETKKDRLFIAVRVYK